MTETETSAVAARRTETVTPAEFITGAAGTGKTSSVRKRIEDDPGWGLLTATTGIAAVNLDTKTLNSALHYFDTDSLEDRYSSGKLTTTLHHLGARNLVIDEVSMLDARQLDIIHRATEEVNEFEDMEGKPLGIVLTGDFCQLPPVKARWAFEAECWHQYEKHTTRLEKNWRQGEGRFLDALNHLRAGRGGEGASLLKDTVSFNRTLEKNFDGAVIVGRNDEVDRINWMKFSQLPGNAERFESRRWGKPTGSWKQIPETLELKEGALVMVLVNEPKDFTYVNGDLGHVIGFSQVYKDGGPKDAVEVELERTGYTVTIAEIERFTEQREEPTRDKFGAYDPPSAFFDEGRKKWITGSIAHMPLRLAYATTAHKSQGLTLDKVQVDLRGHFLGSPAMTYVALSRCRTAQGLRIVGTPELLALRCKTDAKVARWL